MRLIAGPCVIESAKHCRKMAGELKEIVGDRVAFYFKASFDKANRTKLDSFRGPGFRDGIWILDRIRQDFGLRVTTDFHTTHQIDNCGHFVDVIQIPAFLCRQTDLLVSAGKKGQTVNIKKGQFASWEDMIQANIKVGHGNCWITERGTQYGGEVRVDFDKMAPWAERHSTIIDCTHPSNGENQLLLAKMGLLAGAGGVFMEVHDDPLNAKCDGAKSVPLLEFEKSLNSLLRFWDALREEEKKKEGEET